MKWSDFKRRHPHERPSVRHAIINMSLFVCPHTHVGMLKKKKDGEGSESCVKR